MPQPFPQSRSDRAGGVASPGHVTSTAKVKVKVKVDSSGGGGPPQAAALSTTC